MKKTIICIICILISILMYNHNNNYISTRDSIRFRVIANSNSPLDIAMKEKVVNKLSTIIFKSGTKNEIKDNIFNNLLTIENVINDLFEQENYQKKFNVSYGMNQFPKKEYNGVVYPKGLYESLVIEIGEAKGNNYWCFLYPSLCLVDNTQTYKIKNKFRIKELLEKIL